ncbi:MAG: hypothetical protein EA417_04260 [Gammaproteobacteria bacterium]|nr:MAG: hypothetical protein EA417_04260 [Gammaproteobacteria bacterium]
MTTGASRTERKHFRQWLSICCLAVMLAGVANIALAAETDADRALYRDALADLYAVRLHAFEAKLARLEDHPLLPYLHYARLLRYISTTDPDEVRAFLERFADTPLANQALRHWLDNLAQRGQWALYRAFYDPDVAGSAVAQCRYYRSLHETGEKEGALIGAARMWVADESRPDVCDPLFDVWRRAGGLTDALAWERITLVLGANRPSLADYLVRYLDPASERLARDFIALHRQPQRLTRIASLPGDPLRAAEVIAHTLRRLARSDPEAADAAWAMWADRVDLSADAQRRVREEIMRWRIRRDRLPDDHVASWPPTELMGADVSGLVEELARRAIAAERWDEALTWIRRLPEQQRDAINWQYWIARASIEWNSGAGNGFIAASHPQPIPALDPDAALALLTEVAGRRSYYGFMAADRLERPVNLQAQQLQASEEDIGRILDHPAFQRAVELEALGENLDFRREMAWLRARLDTRDLLILAEVCRRRGWHDQSIQATISARKWNHLELRFPLAFAEPMLENAERRRLEPSWLFAVARQESAFMSYARSHAGALGVMQVMPATARITARQLDIPLANTWQLLDYNKNIEIGASYLAQMYDRYQGNRVLASAAYNAGPGRVDQWLSRRPPTPADVWIEGIPFRETRGYVQNVLAFSLIYSHLMELDRPFLYDHER